MCVTSGLVKGNKVRSNSKNIIVEIVNLSKVLTKTNENAYKESCQWYVLSQLQDCISW